MGFFLIFYSSKNSKKKNYQGFQKSFFFSRFLENKSSILELILKDQVTLKTGVMADENSALIQHKSFL